MLTKAAQDLEVGDVVVLQAGLRGCRTKTVARVTRWPMGDVCLDYEDGSCTFVIYDQMIPIKCMPCGEIDCPGEEPLHYPHDGCPHCSQDCHQHRNGYEQ